MWRGVVVRILIADDNASVMSNLRTALNEREGWTVCGEAANGQQAVVMASQLRPDLVVLDWSMPVLNGLDAAREISKASPQMPIVIFTLHKHSQIEREALRVGVKHVVSKAEGTAALFAAIEDLLGSANVPIAPPAAIGPLAVPTDMPPPPIVIPTPVAADAPIAGVPDALVAAAAASANEAGAAPMAPSTEPQVSPAADIAPPVIPPEPQAQ